VGTLFVLRIDSEKTKRKVEGHRGYAKKEEKPSWGVEN